MRALSRPTNRPELWTSAATCDLRRQWYDDVSASEARLRDRWNQSASGKAPEVQTVLAEMSDGCCAYCGSRAEALQVDHYLPIRQFPRLAYCWVNFLPACTVCNSKYKRAYVPESLEADTLFDPVLAEHGVQPGRAYVPAEILPKLTRRLVEPTVDVPADHLEFVPALHGFKAKTSIGEESIRRLFADRRPHAERLSRLSAQVRSFVLGAYGIDDLVYKLSLCEKLVGLRVPMAAYAVYHVRLIRPTWPTDSLHAFADGLL